ncbi:hypothetical protein KQX54_015205 [Cotesia glomerata]|uniref:Uncharacterized protein n=1 Tax=Cotesia glomerata TaxID=32391 RepID=A0AAV7IHR0_COTGL|nr:hypothetical protein KQX54_015205 [Cotesia glomerata]
MMTIHIYGERIPLWQLKPGETLNITTLKSGTVEYLDSIFNDYNSRRMLIQDDDFSSSCKIFHKRKMCVSLNSLKPLLYPDIYLGDDKLDISGLKRSKIENRAYFNAFKNYLDESKYLFTLVKICRLMETQSLYIHPLKIRDLPIVNGNIVHKIQKLQFGLLRFRRGLESHYVSSINTGNCIFQKFHIRKLTSFFRSSVFRSKITKFNQNYHFEIDPEFSNSEKSLCNSLSSFSDLMKNHNSRDLVSDLKLLPLPEAPELSQSVVGNLDVRPGDVRDQNDFSRITSSLMNDIDSTADSVPLSEPKSVFSYSNCFEYHGSDVYLSKSNAKVSDYDYNLNLFEKIISQNDYEVNGKYLIKDYKCFKVRVCSGLHGSKISEMPPIKVIDLDKFLGDGHEYNMVYDDHTLMRLSNKTKLYYVSRMYFGNCLFQAQMYPSSTSFEDVQNQRQLPVYKGWIISPNRKQTLEKLLEGVISSYHHSLSDSVFNLTGNLIDLTLPVQNMLTVKSLISLDLKQID